MEILRTFTLLLLFFVLPLDANAQVLNSKFDTKSHPKGKGVWATVRYPSEWLAKEGERPNIVQKFVGDYSGMFMVLSIQIMDVGAPIEQECREKTTAGFTEDFSDKESGLSVTAVKKTKHENKPAFVYESSAEMERAGSSLSILNKVMTVCHRKALVSLYCSAMTVDKASQTLKSTRNEMRVAEPLCFQYFNSLVLMDSY
jgi:hypothetical protein